MPFKNRVALFDYLDEEGALHIQPRTEVPRSSLLGARGIPINAAASVATSCTPALVRRRILLSVACLALRGVLCGGC